MSLIYKKQEDNSKLLMINKHQHNYKKIKIINLNKVMIMIRWLINNKKLLIKIIKYKTWWYNNQKIKIIIIIYVNNLKKRNKRVQNYSLKKEDK